MNFTIQKAGPVVPPGVNPKFFNNIKFAPIGGSFKFKTGNVAKITAGKIRLRNDEEKSFTNSNSDYAEKGDIVTITGAVYAENQDRDNHASARVFQK